MSKQYDLVELLEKARNNEQKRIDSVTQSINDSKEAEASQIPKFKDALTKTFDNFLKTLSNANISDTKRSFIELQAEEFYKYAINQLNSKSQTIEALFEKMNCHNEKELLANRPYRSTWSQIHFYEGERSQLNATLEKQLAELLQEQNISKISKIERFSTQLIEKMEDLKVFKKIIHDGSADLHFKFEDISRFDNCNGAYKVYVLDCESKKRELFATVGIKGFCYNLTDEEKQCFVTFESHYSGKEFLKDINKMLMVLINNALIEMETKNGEIVICLMRD